VTAFHGKVTPGLAALFLTALFGVLSGMNRLQRSMRQFVGHAGYAADLRDLLERLPPEDSSPDAGIPSRAPQQHAALGPDNTLGPATAEAGRDERIARGRVSFPRPLRSGFHLRGVRYRYPGAAQDALRGIDADVPANEIVALVGANGAGKTTLAQLLLGLRQPTGGRIVVDGTDLSGIPPAEVRRAFAAVCQLPMRYPATLRENVALDRDASPSAEVKLTTALEFAGLGDLAAMQGEMLSPEFGGVDISGGQWQRIAIARALFRPEAQVLVFDEPTAALDPIAEFALFQHFAELASGRTALLVSHRIGPTRLAGHVIVLDRGCVAEQGPPHALLARGGLFAAMFAAQGNWYR
jgi:ABC-type multidrug transport system fused ATPase/permease subunit